MISRVFGEAKLRLSKSGSFGLQMINTQCRKLFDFQCFQLPKTKEPLRHIGGAAQSWESD